MNEATKSLRLLHRKPILEKYLRGRGLDIGCGNDKLEWPGCEVDGWDLPQGDAQYLEGVEPDSYDFVHASHSLEHMTDVPVSLGRWARVVKPGGALVVTVPSWTFYELCRPLPSIFNPDHKQAFCACPMPDQSPMGAYWSIGMMNRLAIRCGLVMEECWLELDRYDFAARASRFCIDQTMSDATAQMCYVFRKPHPDDGKPPTVKAEMKFCGKCGVPLADGERGVCSACVS